MNAPEHFGNISAGRSAQERLADAAKAFEQALRAGKKDPQVQYMLAMCYKRQQRHAEAHAVLREIANPDANVWLQRGLISFAAKNFPDAEKEFAKSWEVNPKSYQAAFNLLMTHVSQNNFAAGIELIPKITAIAPSADEELFLSLLDGLLRQTQPSLPNAAHDNPSSNGSAVLKVKLASLDDYNEQRLLNLLIGLGQPAFPLLSKLALARPKSKAAQQAYAESVLWQAQHHLERCEWEPARDLLTPFIRQPIASTALYMSVVNLLGCCSFMLQEFDQAIGYFSNALAKSNTDPWLHQNLALSFELQGRLDQADRHWNRYFDLLDSRVTSPNLPNYKEHLAFEGLSRLADLYTKKERLNSALGYLQRAHRIRPTDADTMERLFHLYTQLKRFDDAKRILRRMRDTQPDDPQYDLYELDTREVRTVKDIERMVSDIRRILNRYPGDVRVEERAVNLVGSVLPLISRICDDLTAQLNKIVNQMRRLPQYQINWHAVREVMAELEEEFHMLRRVTNKCMHLVTHEEHRRVIRELTDHINQKIELCQSIGD